MFDRKLSYVIQGFENWLIRERHTSSSLIRIKEIKINRKADFFVSLLVIYFKYWNSIPQVITTRNSRRFWTLKYFSAAFKYPWKILERS